jgi:hypothetical protein
MKALSRLIKLLSELIELLSELIEVVLNELPHTRLQSEF